MRFKSLNTQRESRSTKGRRERAEGNADKEL